MTMYDMSQQYHAERIKTAAEQRRTDAELGMMAAEISRIWQRVSRALSRAVPSRVGLRYAGAMTAKPGQNRKQARRAF